MRTRRGNHRVPVTVAGGPIPADPKLPAVPAKESRARSPPWRLRELRTPSVGCGGPTTATARGRPPHTQKERGDVGASPLPKAGLTKLAQ